jgi:hypothetical protein
MPGRAAQAVGEQYRGLNISSGINVIPATPVGVSLMLLRADSIADPHTNFTLAVPTDIQNAATAEKPLSVVENYKE